MAEFRMPSLGADMEAGTLTAWRVQPGDRVRRGDIVATVETDKADIDVEVWVSGTVGELLVREGERVPVGTPLATIVEEAAGAPASRPTPSPAPSPGTRGALPPPTSTAAPAPPPLPRRGPVPTAPPTIAAGGRPRVSPLARATAERLGVDLATVTGTGINGAITRDDVERAAGHGPAPEERPMPSAGAPARPPDRATAMRAAVAAAMARSHREIPHYYLVKTVNLEPALTWLERTNRERPTAERMIPAALFVKAVALAAREVPEMNGHWTEGGVPAV